MVMRMATKSFHEALVIKDRKAAKALINVMDCKSSHKPIKRLDISKELERGKLYLKNRYSP